MPAFVIALDGPAASGKSTVGAGVAQRLGYGYFDTGLLYRALTWLALQSGVDLADADRVSQLVNELNLDVSPIGHVFRDGLDLTQRLQQPDVDSNVSKVAAHGVVRAALRPVQRDLVRPPGFVMAGRDIGTVIVPDAQLKIWLSASAEERARRRSRQTGEDYESVLQGVVQRDRLDGTRAEAPMARAADAVTVDTDELTPDQAVVRIVQLAVVRGAPAPSRSA